MLFDSSRAVLLSTLVENSEATWKKATKCNKTANLYFLILESTPKTSRPNTLSLIQKKVRKISLTSVLSRSSTPTDISTGDSTSSNRTGKAQIF